MNERVLIVNTHPGENPEFVGKLAAFLASVGAEYDVIEPYDGPNPADSNPRCIILTGVPLNVGYSLAQRSTQTLIARTFGWLRDCQRPVLGICFGHQILAHVFGGKVSSLERPVIDPQYSLTVNAREGLFSGIEKLKAFAEHRDYVSVVPAGFIVQCWVGRIPYIMHSPDREMYGVQFAPEQSDDRAKEMLRHFVLG